MPTRRPKRLLALSTVVALAAVSARGAASAQPFASFAATVTYDAVDAAPGDGVCADANGACTLRAAVMEANALPGFNSLVAIAGTFQLTIPGTGEDLALTGDLDINDAITLTGHGTTATVIDGGGLDRVFDVDPASTGGFHAAFTSLMIRNGSTSALSGTPEDRGGGILNRGSALLLGVVVGDNEADKGGGVFNEGFFETAGEISNNRAVGTPASAGGGIYNEGTLNVSQGIIDGNRSSRGGGIFNTGKATFDKGSTISGNAASISAGGIYNEGTITITHTTISGNTLEGLANPGADAIPGPFGTATLTNSTVSGNGSGIGTGGSLTLTNVTIAANTGVGLGAGPFGGINLKNTIIGQNAAADCTPSPTITSLGHNLDSDGSCHLNGPSDISNTDPRLGPFERHSTPFFTTILAHALLPGSPAIDAGDNAGCPTGDQRLFPRPLDGNGDGNAVCDIGAFEADAVTPTPAPTSAPTATPVPPIDLPRTGGDTSHVKPNPLAVAMGVAAIVLAAGAPWMVRRSRS